MPWHVKVQETLGNNVQQSHSLRPRVQELCQAAHHQWQLHGIAVAHRLGVVNVGEASVVIASSSAHRKDALEVCCSEFHICLNLQACVANFLLSYAHVSARLATGPSMN